MPTSVYIFLIGSLFAFLPAWFDHGDTLGELKEATGKRRRLLFLKLCVLWAIPISGLVGTAFLGIESVKSDRQDHQREAQYGVVTNQLLQTSNELATAESQIIAQSSTLRAASIRSPKQRLIDCLNTINGDILKRLKSEPKTEFHVSLDSFKYSELEEFSKNQETSELIFGFQNDGGMEFLSDSSTQKHCKFHLNSSLLQ